MRLQSESMQSANTILPPAAALLAGAPALPFVASVDTEFERFSGYGYYELKLADSLKLTGGLTYDWERYPDNLGQPPLSSKEDEKGRLSPKIGLDWTPGDGTRVRADWARSMGGLINDSSTTIEPSEIAGFNQSFRSLIPQSAGFGTPPALVFETYGVGVDHKFPTGTYLDLEAEFLTSSGNQLIGAYNGGLGGVAISEFSQSQYFNEQDVFASLSQLISKEVSVGARYSITAVDVTVDDYSPATAQLFPQHENSTLNELSMFANYYVPCGFFSQFQANWWAQHNANNQFSVTGPEPGANFWQCNLYAGYRFPRRHIELAMGLVNMFNQGYNVDPVAYFLEQARTRTLMASLKFNF
jgi:outer membrane receptor protein involved in Fe transport